MSTQTIERVAPPLAARIPGKYMSLVSFKRDGTPVATPMWFVVDGERLLAITDAHSAKVRRVRRTPGVTLAACRANGRQIGQLVAARAEVLPPGDVEHVQELIARKYRLDRILILPVYNFVQRLRGKRHSGEAVALAITPTTPGRPSGHA